MVTSCGASAGRGLQSKRRSRSKRRPRNKRRPRETWRCPKHSQSSIRATHSTLAWPGRHARLMWRQARDAVAYLYLCLCCVCRVNTIRDSGDSGTNTCVVLVWYLCGTSANELSRIGFTPHTSPSYDANGIPFRLEHRISARIRRF